MLLLSRAEFEKTKADFLKHIIEIDPKMIKVDPSSPVDMVSAVGSLVPGKDYKLSSLIVGLCYNIGYWDAIDQKEKGEKDDTGRSD